MMTTVI